MDREQLLQTVSKPKSALRILGMGGALGVSVAVACLVPAMADSGVPGAQANGTIVGNVVGTDLGVLRSSLAVPASSAEPRQSAVAAFSENVMPVLTDGAAGISLPGFSPSAGTDRSTGPATVSSGSGARTASAPASEATPTVHQLAPSAVVEQGGFSVGTTSSDGGGGGDTAATVAPTAVTGDTGSAQSQSTSSNSGNTGSATSSAISNPVSGSGGSGSTGGSGATESTPSVTTSGI